MTSVEELRGNSYRIFFPIVAFGGALAVGLWIPYYLGQKGIMAAQSYPGLVHSEIIAGGFLLPVISGFALTAVPRFTRSEFPSAAVLAVLFLFEIALPFTGLLEDRIYFRILHAVAWTTLAALLVPRIIRGAATPVVWIIGAAIAAGSIGTIFAAVDKIDPVFLRLGRSLLHYGMLPLIILGAGAVLVVPMGSPTDRNAWRLQLQSATKREAGIFLGLYFISFAVDLILDGAGYPLIGAAGSSALRFVLVFFWMTRYFHVLEVKSFKGPVGFSFWAASISILCGLGGASFPDQAVHFAHMFFVGGAAQFILTISVHVIQSHGGHGSFSPARSRALWAILFLVVLAALTRSTAAIWPRIYLSHLAYAAVLFIIALIVWFIFFGRLIFIRPAEEK